MPDPNNNRIFYACQAVAIGKYQNLDDTPPATPEAMRAVHGVQSVGINTTFNLEQAFELGQISIYENIEGLPDVEVTIEKVLDGYPLIYHMATSGAQFRTGTNKDSLVARTKERCNVALGIFSDANEAVSGIAPHRVLMSGMYVNSLSYTFPTDGNCTESVTLVGNSKAWTDSSQYGWDNTLPIQLKYNSDSPIASGGIQRREDVIMQSSIMPAVLLYQMTKGNPNTPSGVGNNWDSTKNVPIMHIQNISISTDLGREDILELGQKEPYYRAATFPVEVTSEFEVIAVSGDYVNAYSDKESSADQIIKIMLRDGTEFDLGNKNRISSVNYTGGDAGGGNATISYSFTNFNDLTIKQPNKFKLGAVQ